MDLADELLNDFGVDDEILEKDGISKGAIEFLKEHDAYEDVLDAFYSDSLDYIN